MAIDDITRRLGKDGRQPTIKLAIEPLDTDRRFNRGQPFQIERFNSYSFSSNILIPVDTFAFTFRPDPPTKGNRGTYYDRIVMEGDAVQLSVGGDTLATGYVDGPSSDTDADNGTTLTVNGRDMMGFLESNDAVNPDSSILYAGNANIQTVMGKLLENTRIQGYETRGISEKVTSFFATNPGESKLAALQRFLEPLNAIAWTAPNGKLICGKPSFGLAAVGTLGILMFERKANVLRMRVQRNSGHIPNAVLSIWTGLESVQTIVAKDTKINQAAGPNRLYKAGHRLYRAIVTSAPDASDTKQGLADVQRYISQGNNFLDSIAARELARENVNELLVTCSVPGHLNANGDPYATDTCYNIVYDAEGIDEKMYLFGVEYALSEDGGQVTHLAFCKLNTIVSGGFIESNTVNQDGQLA